MGLADSQKMQDDFEKFLVSLSHRGMRRSLDRMLEAVKRLNHPEKKYPIVHIAGTNGKGSSCAFIAQMFALSGYKVGLYLSPHAIDYRERIQILNPRDALSEKNWVSWDKILNVHQYFQSQNLFDLELTYFEYTTLLAFEIFHRDEVNIAIIETGMGGRWDATNVCDAIFTGITTIGLDHTAILGNTKEKILAEKLEIAKNSPHFLFGPTDPALVKQARQFFKNKNTVFHKVNDLKKNICRPHIESLDKKGSYLDANLNFAVAAMHILGKEHGNIDWEKIYQAKLRPLPARLEWLSTKPPVLMDAAHNMDGLKALKQIVDRIFPSGYDLVFGCLRDRDFRELIPLIKSDFENYWVSFEADGRELLDTDLKLMCEEFTGQILHLDETGLDLLSSREKSRPLLTCGSFYLCSAFRQFWRQYENILK